MDASIGKILKWIVTIIVLAAIMWLLVKISSTITILIIAALLAYILDPIASYLEYKGLSRTQGTIVVFLLIAAILITIISYFIPPLINELSNIEKSISSGEATAYFAKVEEWIKINVPFLSGEELDLQGKFSSIVLNFSNSFFSIIGSLVSFITTMIIIPFAVFFLLKDGRHMKKVLVTIIPNRYFEMSLNMLHKTDQQLGGYLRGQFFDALIIGIMATIALWILNVPYFMIIGIFAGLANMIPYVGPLAGAVAAIFVVLLDGGGSHQIMFVAMAFGIIQLTDNVLVQPLVVAKSVDLHPLLVIFAVIIGGQFFGILGMILAVPTTGMLKVLFNEIFNAVRKYNLI